MKLSLPNLRTLPYKRILVGGKVDDFSRLNRYFGTIFVTFTALWTIILTIYSITPKSYSTDFTLLIPGTGQSSNVSLESIGQASTFSVSPFSSTLSPTENYKRLLVSDRVITKSAEITGIDVEKFPKPKVKLVDRTNFITVKISALDADSVYKQANALYEGFQDTLNTLRQEELHNRTKAFTDSLRVYKENVAYARQDILELQVDEGLVSIDQFSELIAHVGELEQRKLTLRSALADREARIKTLEGILKLTPGSSAIALKLGTDTALQQLLADYGADLAALATARSKFGQNHPSRRSLQRKSDATLEQALALAAKSTDMSADKLRDFIRYTATGFHADNMNDLIKLTVEKNGMLNEISLLENQITSERDRLKELSQTASRLDDLTRDHQIAEAVFSSAIARNETNKSDIFSAYPMVQLIESPKQSDIPSSPDLKLTIILGIAASLFTLMGLILTWVRNPLIKLIVGRKPKPHLQYESAIIVPPAQEASSVSFPLGDKSSENAQDARLQAIAPSEQKVALEEQAAMEAVKAAQQGLISDEQPAASPIERPKTTTQDDKTGKNGKQGRKRKERKNDKEGKNFPSENAENPLAGSDGVEIAGNEIETMFAEFEAWRNQQPVRPHQRKLAIDSSSLAARLGHATKPTDHTRSPVPTQSNTDVPTAPLDYQSKEPVGKIHWVSKPLTSTKPEFSDD